MTTTKPFRLKAPRLKEADVTKQIIDFLRIKGYRCIRQNSGLANYGVRGMVRYGEPGMTDWIAVHPSRPCIFLELKREGQTIRPARELRLKQHPYIATGQKTPAALKREIEQAEFIEDRKREGFRALWTNNLAEFRQWFEAEVN